MAAHTPSQACPLAAAFFAAALASTALAAPPARPAVEALATASLPSIEAREGRGRGDDLRLSAYPGGPSLAAWRAAPRGPLSVLVALPAGGLASFLAADPRRVSGAPAPETCVPASYRWAPVSLRWERLSIDRDGPLLEESSATFEPARCRASTALRSVARPAPLGQVDGVASLLAFRRGDEVVVLLPRSARVVAEEPAAVLHGTVTRVRLASLPGAATRLQAAFPAGALSAWQAQLSPSAPPPVPSAPFVLDVELVESARGPLLVIRRQSPDPDP